MIIKFKDGGVRQVPFKPHLAARLINLGHQIDYDEGTSPERRQYEQREIQRQFDWIQEKISCGKKY